MCENAEKALSGHQKIYKADVRMDIAKQIIDQRINKIIEDNRAVFDDGDSDRNRSKAFLLLGVAAYLDIDITEAVQYLTDGGYGGGFDAPILWKRRTFS